MAVAYGAKTYATLNDTRASVKCIETRVAYGVWRFWTTRRSRLPPPAAGGFLMIVELRSSEGLFHHVRKGVRATERARARAGGYHDGVRVTSDWSRGTRAESSRASVRGPLFVDDNLVRARVRDGAGYVARTPFKKLVILDLVTFSPPPQGRVRPNCGTQARLEGTPDRLLEEEPAPRRSPDAQVLPLNTQGWPSLCPPAQRYAREP